LIQANAALPNAPDLLSLLPALEAPAQSTNSSAPIAQDFSALLTELIGPIGQMGLSNAASTPQGGLPATEAVPELKVAEVKTPELSLAGMPPCDVKTPGLEIPDVKLPEIKTPEMAEAKTSDIKTPELKTPEIKTPELILDPKTPGPKTSEVKPIAEDKTSPEPKVPEVEVETAKLPELPLQPGELAPKAGKEAKGKEAAKEQEGQVNSPVVTPLDPVVLVAVPAMVAAEAKPVTKIEEPVLEKPVQLPPPPVATRSPIDPVWADVKKFEFTVQREAAASARPQPEPAATPAEAPKEAMITSDPLMNIRQEQLPRIIAVEKVNVEARLPERSKSDAEPAVNETTTVPTLHFSDVARHIEQVEHVRAAQPVEIPHLPQSHVVRSVAIEVGDADSQVMIRIQERGGDLSMHLNAAAEPLHRDLQHSVGSLVESLRQEEVKVASIEVSRKSPIEKVRRSKEAQ
jgi:hypothetical protein